MYYPSSSLVDRARECLRNAAAEVPIWRINPDKLARRTLEGLPASDPKEAETHYLDAFRAVHAEMLRDAIADALPGNIAKHIQPVRLLWMPDGDALEDIGDTAGYFEDGFDGKEPDGDLLLVPADDFSEDELAAALEAGGEVVEGYKFYYPDAVVINRRSPRIIAPGKVAVGGWCAYFYALVGYALRREIAEAVCAASIMMEAAHNDAEKHIRPTRLLWIRRSDLLELGNAAGHFSDNGKKPDPDGDAWLAPANVFSLEELAAALRAGGELINGYAFLYPRGVVVNRHLPCVAVAGEVEDDRWCGYSALGIGYTLLHDVAEAVCAASIAQAKEEEVAEAVCAASIMMKAARNDAEKHIRPTRLLWMPGSLLEALGDAARHFRDNGRDPDGGALYAPADVFSSEELAVALRAGGAVTDGYSFPYQRGVAINRHLPCVAVAGEVKDDRWCGYPSLGIGYAVWRDVAEAVCAASIARAKEGEE